MGNDSQAARVDGLATWNLILTMSVVIDGLQGASTPKLCLAEPTNKKSLPVSWEAFGAG
jgi:hypothetical protein